MTFPNILDVICASSLSSSLLTCLLPPLSTTRATIPVFPLHISVSCFSLLPFLAFPLYSPGFCGCSSSVAHLCLWSSDSPMRENLRLCVSLGPNFLTQCSVFSSNHLSVYLIVLFSQIVFCCVFVPHFRCSFVC